VKVSVLLDAVGELSVCFYLFEDCEDAGASDFDIVLVYAVVRVDPLVAI